MNNIITRPAIGAVVEGKGEYYCYPSLVSRIVNTPGLYIPVVYAGGIGNIRKHLHENLSDLVLSHKPYIAVITIDLRDNLESGFTYCQELKEFIVKQARDWIISVQDNERFQPLPVNIEVVIQIQQFESWYLSDPVSLANTGFFDVTGLSPGDTDTTILNPANFLEDHKMCERKLKDPQFAKEIISGLDPSVMRTNSKSFDKFYREISKAYTSWCEECGFVIP